MLVLKLYIKLKNIRKALYMIWSQLNKNGTTVTFCPLSIGGKING